MGAAWRARSPSVRFGCEDAAAPRFNEARAATRMSRGTRAPDDFFRGVAVNGAQSELFARAGTSAAETGSKPSARGASRGSVTGASLRLTGEQTAIVEAAVSGEALAVEAGAGSGKTTTCAAVARAMGRRRGILVVYNAMAAKTTSGKLVGTGCEARTLHSIAYRSGFAEPFKRGGRLNMALPARAAAEAAGLTRWLSFDARGEYPLTPTAQGYLLKDWVGNFCHSADEALGPKHFPWGTLRDYASGWLSAESSHDMPDERPERQRQLLAKAAGDFGRLLEGGAQRLWERMSGPGDFPSNHDIYLKLYVMSRPRAAWDYLLLDEAQDANPLALQFFNLAREQGCQTIAVGDSHQQLYAWRGAVDAMRQIDSHRRLALTQSFRFGPAVAEVANRVLALGGSAFRIRGAGGPSTVEDHVHAPTAVICRTNGAAIGIALELAEEGRNPALCLERGAMLSEIDALERFEATGRSAARRYCAFRSFDELRESVESGDMPDVKILLELAAAHGYDGTRSIISDMAVGKNQAAIDSSGRDVVCLTTHAAKGLEFRRVLLADDFGPKPNEKKGETEAAWRARLADAQEDLNVFYVAVTRAQEALGVGESPLARLVTGRPILDRPVRPGAAIGLEPEEERDSSDLGRGE